MRDLHQPGRSTVHATNGMCATSHPHAVGVALDILKSGGNAMDAAIAGAVVLGFCEPQMCGIGGDCFVVFTPPGSDKVLALNGSGRAPMAIDPEAIRAEGTHKIPPTSAHAVTIPGAVDAFCRLSEEHGKLGLDRILAPAIDAAENGIPVAPRVAFDWSFSDNTMTGAARDFFSIGGRAAKVGHVFRAPLQAEVLRRIAKDGRAAFYEGEVAEDMVAALQAAGGRHALDDFAATDATPTDPIIGPVLGHDLAEHPPNGVGATALLMAKMLSHFDIASMDPLGAERAHIEAEVTKLAYDARNRFVADPDHTTRLDHMLSDRTAKRLADLVDPKRALPDPERLTEEVHKDTIYITVVDRDGMKVSLIYSIFSDFGAKIASPGFGILFQNRGAGFNLMPGHANEAGPGKRPMHTIIPAILMKDDQAVMPFGVMGGPYQPLGHTRFLSNLFDFGMDLQEAIDAPRAFAFDGELRLETTYPDHIAQSLEDLGHKVVRPPKPIGGAQAIWVDREKGVLTGASDPRKDGCALGY